MPWRCKVGPDCAVGGPPLLPRRCVCVALWLGVSFGSCCCCWLRVLLMCSQLVLLSCLAAGDSALWGGIWRRPVPSSWAGGDGLRFMRAVGCVGASFRVEVGMGGHWRTTHAFVHESVNMGGRGGGRFGRCMRPLSPFGGIIVCVIDVDASYVSEGRHS